MFQGREYSVLYYIGFGIWFLSQDLPLSMKIIKLLIVSKQIKIKLCTGSIHKKFQIPVSIKNTKKSRGSTRRKQQLKWIIII